MAPLRGHPTRSRRKRSKNRRGTREFFDVEEVRPGEASWNLLVVAATLRNALAELALRSGTLNAHQGGILKRKYGYGVHYIQV